MIAPLAAAGKWNVPHGADTLERGCGVPCNCGGEPTSAAACGRLGAAVISTESLRQPCNAPAAAPDCAAIDVETACSRVTRITV